MKYLNIILLSILLPYVNTKKIQPVKPRFCINCKHFQYNNNANNKIGKCMLFPMNENYYIVNNNCFITRKNESMCGEEGKYYVSK